MLSVEITETQKEQFASLNISDMIKWGDEILLIKMAIEAGADIHRDNDKALSEAISREDSIELLELLKSSGMDFGTNFAASDTQEAILNHHFSSAIFLVENGVNVHWNNDVLLRTTITNCYQNGYSKRYYGIIKAIINKMDIDTEK